jgi:EAL domain-containing protein (putative c-di-GMP-specific phosphodiesterase class I)
VPDDDLAADLPAALDAGRIRAWFQPLLSTETGRVSGMEALARWEHPGRGVIAPAAFLPVVEALGLQRRLTAAMLDGALDAVAAWDAAGCDVPCVSVNFSGADLADPMLADRVAWALDRLELAPARLTIEVLETVIAETGADDVTRTINGLGRLGCTIALDDFGTGQAAIGAIRRFGVDRIKIDRSFVRRIDTDPDQHMMLTAILDLARRLRVETVAEGVETVGEHALLAQLGCDHVQGYAVARPMPAADTFDWLRRHQAGAVLPPWPDLRTG